MLYGSIDFDTPRVETSDSDSPVTTYKTISFRLSHFWKFSGSIVLLTHCKGVCLTVSSLFGGRWAYEMVTALDYQASKTDADILASCLATEKRM